MGKGGSQVEGSEPEEADVRESDEDWPVLSELDLDVCVSEFVPDANADADPEDA